MNVLLRWHSLFTENLSLNLDVFGKCLNMLVGIFVLIGMIRARTWSAVVMRNFLGSIVEN
jgi:hypothetical protein